MTKETLILWYDTYIKNCYPLCNNIYVGDRALSIDHKGASLNLPFEEIKELNVFASISDNSDDNSQRVDIFCKSGIQFTLSIY